MDGPDISAMVLALLVYFPNRRHPQRHPAAPVGQPERHPAVPPINPNVTLALISDDEMSPSVPEDRFLA